MEFPKVGFSRVKKAGIYSSWQLVAQPSTTMVHYKKMLDMLISNAGSGNHKIILTHGLRFGAAALLTRTASFCILLDTCKHWQCTLELNSRPDISMDKDDTLAC